MAMPLIANITSNIHARHPPTKRVVEVFRSTSVIHSKMIFISEEDLSDSQIFISEESIFWMIGPQGGKPRKAGGIGVIYTWVVQFFVPKRSID
jgi:hypothetical protein